MKTLRLRLKDKHVKVLKQLAYEVNQVWNFTNELAYKHLQRTGKFFSAYDLQKYTTGLKEVGFNVHSQTVQAVVEEYTTRRKQFKKAKLRWRKTKGSGRSLGWIPFKKSAIGYKNGQIRFGKYYLSLWDSYGLSDYELGSGSISEDARGRWYINITVDTKEQNQVHSIESILNNEVPSIGIDLGLKDFATLSNGVKVIAEQFYRKEEPKLAVAQRANNKKRVKAIHTKIANKRNDQLHKLSTRLVNENAYIAVGDVSSSKLVKTKMAKSVLDAGWSKFRAMLVYKCADAGALFEEVNESYSTQTCSVCGSVSGPRGLNGLGIREWLCSDCGAIHDRDHNAAKNLLARGHSRLAEGIPCL